MNAYFDPAIPVNPSSAPIMANVAPADPTGANTPQTITCVVCYSTVWNLATYRDAHAAWHDLIAVTAVGAFGMATNPAGIPLSGTTDIVVPLSREMPTTTYAASAEIVSGVGTVLQGANVQGIVARTKTAVTVRVANTGLSLLGQSAVTVAVLARGPLS